MGGYNILGTGVQTGLGYTRTFMNLPSHNKIHLSFTLWIIDTIDATDYFQVSVGSRTFKSWPTTSGSWGITNSLCGTSTEDNPNLRVFIQAVHTSSTLTLQFLTYANKVSISGSYGFRDVRIHFVNTSISVSESLCTTPGPGIPSSYLCGGCYEGEYYDTSSGDCLLCNDACTSCYGPNAEDCFQCESGYGWSGTACVKCDPSCNGCHGTTSADCEACASGQALWIFSYDATTLKPYTPRYCAAESYCVSPYGTLTVADAYGYKYCQSPCYSDEFVYWDGTCNSTCASPLTPVYETPFFKFCTWTCPLTTVFMYWDGSCDSSCPSPMQTITYASKSFCAYPCQESQYLYWDGSCEATCPFPFTTDQYLGRSFCKYPCASLEYLYWDGTCQTECNNPPLTPYTYKTASLCQYTCSVNTDYLYPDGTCDSTCASPLTVIENFNKLFCTSACGSQYLYWDGSCSSTCSTPPLSSSTFHLIPVCEFPCSSSTDYAYPDGSCSSTCPYPRTITVTNERSFCVSSCGSQSLYWDGSCSSTCASPLQGTTQNGILLCTYACTDLTEYLYWNGTCSSTCNSPFVKVISNDRNYCTFPCSGSTPYMNWDGTCVSSCTSPYVPVTYGLKTYCRSPCATGMYMLSNGSCASTCYFPLVQSSLEGAFYCNSPCSSTQFYYWNGSCLDLCPSPYVIVQQNRVTVCTTSCSTTQYRVSNGSCVNSCPFPMIAKSTTSGSECNSPCSGSTLQYYNSETQECTDYCFSTILLNDGLYLECAVISSQTNLVDYLLTATSKLEAATVLTLVDLLGYIKYTNVNLSPRLAGLAANRGRYFISIKFGFHMPEALQEKFTQGSLPTVFERFSTPSSFLVNFWRDLTSWAIVLLAGLTFAIVEEISNQNDSPVSQAIFAYLKRAVFWNVMVMLYATSIGDIIMFASIQIRAVELNEPGDIVSLVLTIVLLISIPVSLFYMTRHYSKTHLPFGDSLVPPERAVKFQVIIQGYSAKTKKFYFTYILRIIILGVISAALVSTAVTQAVFNTLISAFMVFYVVRNKPIKRRINQIQLVCLEVIILITNFFMFLVSISSNKDNTLTTSGIFFADLVILGNFCIHILFLLFLLAKFVIISQDLYKLYKVKKDLAKIGCVNFIFAYLQQGAFGFEEILQIDLTPPQTNYDDEKRNLVHSNPASSSSNKSETTLKKSSSLRNNGQYNHPNKHRNYNNL